MEGWGLYYKEYKEHDVANCPKKQHRSYYAKNVVSKDILDNKTK